MNELYAPLYYLFRTGKQSAAAAAAPPCVCVFLCQTDKDRH